MASPNLFDFATKELSQDAVICWLIAWAGTEANRSPAEEKLRLCGLGLVKALFAKWRDWGEVELGDSVRTCVVRQERNIDVLAGVDGRHVLLIEDKTDTGSHDGQLERYRTLVLEGETALGQVAWNDLYPIYCRTGNHSLKDRIDAENEGYRVFDRNDFLNVLEEYGGTNSILVDFRDHLRRWKRQTDSFLGWTRNGDRTSRGWEGFYRSMECKAGFADSHHDEWGPLKTQTGSYWGIWTVPREQGANSSFAMWIEKDRISFRLYGATDRVISVPGMNREKEYWAKAFVERYPKRLRRPRRLAATRTRPMSVAEWRGWLAFGEEDRLDLDATLENLVTARKMLLSTILGRRP